MKAFEIVERVDVPQDALDRQTGKEVWKAEWKGAMTVAGLGTSMGSWIRATPALDGKRLWTLDDVRRCQYEVQKPPPPPVKSLEAA